MRNVYRINQVLSGDAHSPRTFADEQCSVVLAQVATSSHAHDGDKDVVHQFRFGSHSGDSYHHANYGVYQ